MDLGNLGFDFDAVLAAIEDRFLGGLPGARPETHVVHALMDAHMLEHGVPVLLEMDGVLVPAPRCSVWPCPLAGLAFAAFELRWYKINASDVEEAALFEQAAACLALRDEIRQAFRDMATRRREALFSRPLQVPWSRRPPAALAQAVAQHLRSGASSYPAIGSLMGSTSGCAEKRCAAPDFRSVMPYSEVEDRGAA
ncbi:MAG: hypothetical protein EOO73_34835 [Myxococcales bacterium]|nr:MAG: hypothetical protein EOO73_34835 [Myxococcales bacterium]